LRLGNPARISEEVLMNTLDAKLTRHESYKHLKSYRKNADEYFRMQENTNVLLEEKNAISVNCIIRKPGSY